MGSVIEPISVQDLIRSIHAVLVVFDPEGRVRLWNPAAEDSLALSPGAGPDQVAGRLGAEVVGAVRTALTRGAPVRVDEVSLEVGGRPRTFGFTVSPIRGDDGPAGAVLTGRDITSRVRLASTLEDLTRRADRESALRRLVHELRTPLNSILGTAQYLELITEPEAPPRRYARLIAEEASRLSRLLDGVDELRRARALRLRAADPLPAVRRAVEVMAPLADEAGVRLETGLPTSLPPVSHDPDRLEEVALNLMQNAVEAAGAGGTVRVAAGSDSQGVWISVEDDGPGVPEEILPRLFQPFVSGKPGRGRGLGLALCREIVEEHGGEIVCEPPPAEGALFRVQLPRL